MEFIPDSDSFLSTGYKGFRSPVDCCSPFVCYFEESFLGVPYESMKSIRILLLRIDISSYE